MYDKQTVYDARIKELVKKILLICSAEQIPVILSFAVKDDGKHTSYVSEMISPMASGTKLSDDRIAKHAAVVHGFDVIPASRALARHEIMEDIQGF